MALLVVMVLLALACFALLPLARLLTALPDSNEDFVFWGTDYHSAAVSTTERKSVMPAHCAT